MSLIRRHFIINKSTLAVHQNSPLGDRGMKIQFWSIGKNHDPSIKDAVEDFTRRISKYFPVEWTIIPVPKNAGMMSEMDLKKKEGEMILDWLKKPARMNRSGGDDYLVVLDGHGKEMTSDKLAEFIQARANESVKTLIFLIGGVFGLDKMILQRANHKWSLSQLTFPHQLVRLILAEQVYRACTIIRNEKYHHQ
jgi:23S rRNA (pseudouridine1915-N3)-methyltransferase